MNLILLIIILLLLFGGGGGYYYGGPAVGGGIGGLLLIVLIVYLLMGRRAYGKTLPSFGLFAADEFSAVRTSPMRSPLRSSLLPSTFGSSLCGGVNRSSLENQCHSTNRSCRLTPSRNRSVPTLLVLTLTNL
jgi:hypothetical protein